MPILLPMSTLTKLIMPLLWTYSKTAFPSGPVTLSSIDSKLLSPANVTVAPLKSPPN